MKNNSCIVTVIKNEQEYLDWWIQYHIDLGVDHIFIFEDYDSDSHRSIVEKYPEDKVTLESILVCLNGINKNEIVDLKKTKKNNIQFTYIMNTLKYIKDRYVYKYDWAFVIDIDEYITLENETDKLSDVLSLYEDYDAVIIQWKNYGANGHVKKPDYGDKGLIGTYVKESEGCAMNKPELLTKTIYKLKKFYKLSFLNTHQPSDLANFCRTDFTKDRKAVVYDKIYLRHYITKSWEEYVWKKQKRGYFFGFARTNDFFFGLNPDMADKKHELVKEYNMDTLVVLPYKQNGSQGRELELALKSWKKFCRFDYHFVVIGVFDDHFEKEFPWVDFIHKKPIETKKGQYQAHIDIQNSFEIAMETYGDQYDGFIWMVDDNYAIRPFKLEAIKKTHYHEKSFSGSPGLPPTFWKHDKYKTRKLLDREKLPCVNYTTHFPCWFEFEKLKKLWDKHDMRNESYVIEDIYFNTYEHDEPALDSEIRFGVWKKPLTEEEFKKATYDPRIRFVCNSVEGWSEELENQIEKIINS